MTDETSEVTESTEPADPAPTGSGTAGAPNKPMRKTNQKTVETPDAPAATPDETPDEKPAAAPVATTAAKPLKAKKPVKPAKQAKADQPVEPAEPVTREKPAGADDPAPPERPAKTVVTAPAKARRPVAVGAAAAPDDDQPRRRVRVAEVLVLVAVVVLLAVIAVKVLAGGDDSGPTATSDGRSAAGGSGGSAGAAVPAEPESAPGRGGYVESTVGSDGTVSVRQWIRSNAPIRSLEVALTQLDASATGTAQAQDVVVQALDGSVLARSDTVGGDTVKLDLGDGVPNLYLSYTITGGVDDATQTVQGRMLVNVLGMDVDYSGSSGTVQRLVTGPGTVTNVACVRVSAQATAPPKPCGKPTDDGGWLVNLRGIDRSDRLLAQLDADS